MAEPAAIRYRAFLSYSHRDAAWAKWLHKALESYRIDKDLVGRETLVGPVPKTLRPIFRDREDFSARPHPDRRRRRRARRLGCAARAVLDGMRRHGLPSMRRCAVPARAIPIGR